MRHFICLSLLACCGVAAAADDVSLIGVMGERAAVLAVGGGDPKTVKVGQTWNGITVRSVAHDEAIVEIGGEKRILHIGQGYRSAGATSGGRGKATLASDTRGHFFADGAVNGVPVRFVVDTGATMVCLPRADAERLGLDYRHGQRGMSRTANGPVPVYMIKLDAVKVGGIELHNVDALVIDGGLDQALLGMSFLNRVEMQRDGPTMTLTQRF